MSHQNAISSRLTRAFGPRPKGRVVSVTSRGGVSSRATRSLLLQQQKESKARNAASQVVLDRQRAKQAKLMKQAREQISKTGASRRRDIQESGVRRQGQSQQSLISRGLGNTTIQDSVKRGINDSTDRSMTHQRDLEAGQMSGLYSREAGMQLGEGQFQLGGVKNMSGGLDDYIRMLSQLGGGLS